jgi:hypothetical protein
LAEHDARRFDIDSPGTIERLLHGVVPSFDRTVTLLRQGDRVHVMCSPSGESCWLDSADEEVLVENLVIADVESPLDAVVRIWRTHVEDRLRPHSRAPALHPATTDDACVALTDHFREIADETRRFLAEAFCVGHSPAVATTIGPLGMTVRVQADPGRSGWAVYYRPGDDIDVERTPAGWTPDTSGWGETSVRHILSEGPSEAASKAIVDAINRLTGRKWL